jgi:hypothetical protein
VRKQVEVWPGTMQRRQMQPQVGRQRLLLPGKGSFNLSNHLTSLVALRRYIIIQLILKTLDFHKVVFLFFLSLAEERRRTRLRQSRLRVGYHIDSATRIFTKSVRPAENMECRVQCDSAISISRARPAKDIPSWHPSQ